MSANTCLPYIPHLDLFLEVFNHTRLSKILVQGATVAGAGAGAGASAGTGAGAGAGAGTNL